MRASPIALDGEIPTKAIMMNRFGRTSALAFCLQVAGVGMTYVAQLLAARLAGPENYGIYAYVTSIIIVVAYLAALGYDSAMLRFLPTYGERQATHLVAGMMIFVEKRVKRVAFAAAGFGLVAILATMAGRSPQRIEAFGLGLVLIPIWTLSLVRCAAVRALGSVLTAQLCERISRDGSFAILLILGTVLLPFAVDATTLVGAMVASALFTLTIATRAARALAPVETSGPSCADESELWRRVAYPFLAMVAAETLINRCGVLMLGSLGRTADAGCFALITNLATLVMLPRLAVNAFLTPMIARLYARGDLAGLELIVAKGSLWSVAGAAAIGAAVWITSPILLRLYGPSFVAGQTALGILILAQTIATGAEAQLQLLKMTGREIAAAKVLFGSLLIQVVLSLALIPTMGLLGASIASLGCLLAWNVSMMPIVWRHLGIRPGRRRLRASASV